MRVGLSRNEGLLVITGALWGTAYVAIKAGLAEGDPYLFALLRFLLGSVVLVAVILVFGKLDVRLFRDPIMWAVAVLNSLCIVVQNVGMTMTTATNAVLLFNINIGFIALLAAIILKERLGQKLLVGLGVGTVGVVLISTNGDLSSIYSGTFQGNVLILMSGVFWALCTVLLKKVLDRGADILNVTGALFLLSTVSLVPITLLFTADYAMSTVAWESVLWTGVVCTGIAYLTYNLGLRTVKVTSASIILLLESVFALLFAFLLLNEVPTGSIALGGGLVVLSIIVITLPGPRVDEQAEGREVIE